MKDVEKQLSSKYPKEWILGMELLELCSRLQLSSELREAIRLRLLGLAKEQPSLHPIIERGLNNATNPNAGFGVRSLRVRK